MNCRIPYIVYFFLHTYPLICLAQQVDSLHIEEKKLLDPVTIEASRLHNFSIGGKSILLDTGVIRCSTGSGLADALTNHSFLFIRNNGISGVATAGFRGTNANHTAVIWNGFNLQNAMHGTADLNLITLLSADEIYVQQGGASALYGSGALGASIYLNGRQGNIKGLSVASKQVLGSFGKWFQHYQLSYSNASWTQVTKVYHSQSKNDFPFISKTASGDITVRQPNARVMLYGLLQENYFNIGKKHRLNIRFWYQNARRQLPPPNTKRNSKEQLLDKNYRMSVHWKVAIGKSQFIFRTAWFQEDNTYENPDFQPAIDAVNSSRSSITETEANIPLGKYILFNIGMNNTLQSGRSDNYLAKIIRNNSALFSSVKARNLKKNFTAILSIRQGISSGELLPLIPALSVEWLPQTNFLVRANISRNYRIPTFNELHWMPGGNPKLSSETGWGGQLSAGWSRQYRRISLACKLTAFHHLIDQWIRWQPHDTENYWLAENILKVWTRGVEVDTKINCYIHKWKFSWQNDYSLIRSTKKAASQALEIDKQLIYTPLYNAFTQLGISYRGWEFSYTHRYVGKRYTTSDESASIPSFHLGNVVFNKIFFTEQYRIIFFFKVNNCWNRSYQVLPAREMPRRNFQIGISGSMQPFNS